MPLRVPAKLAVTVCRQSSYTSPNMRIIVNGVAGGVWSGEDGIRRPQVCGDRFGQSFAIDGIFTAGGAVVRNAGVTIEGIYFDGSTATTISRGAGYDNPYN